MANLMVRLLNKSVNSFTNLNPADYYLICIISFCAKPGKSQHDSSNYFTLQYSTTFLNILLIPYNVRLLSKSDMNVMRISTLHNCSIGAYTGYSNT